jgi:acetate kinase
MNLMEAEHVKKKYQIIQSSLQEDSVAFKSSLTRIEEAIGKQESEIRHLKVSVFQSGLSEASTHTLLHECVLQAIHGEALGLRDVTRGTLVRQELDAVNVAKAREEEVQDLR